MPITDFDKVELLLPMTGANNGTVFADRSLRQRTVTRVGTVTSTAQSKFAAYGSSGYFVGASDHQLSVADAAGLRFGSSDWLIELYVRFASLPASGVSAPLVAKFNTAGDKRQYFTSLRNEDGTYKLRTVTYPSGTNTGLVDMADNVSVSTNTWYHMRFSRVGSQFRQFLDGVGGATHTPSDIFNSDQPVTVGYSGVSGTWKFDGFMQDLVIYKGHGNLSDFTPPARRTDRTLTRANTGTDSHEYDRAVLFDWNTSAYPLKTATPDVSGNFSVSDLIDLEYGVAFIRDGCSPVCRGPFEVDPDA
jgi:hypothetical protein